MKNLIITIFIVVMANQIKAQLPQCLIQKFSVDEDVYSEIRVAFYKNDTCYVIDRWDPSTTGHERS